MTQRQIDLCETVNSDIKIEDKQQTFQITPRVSVEVFKVGSRVKMRLRKSSSAIMLDIETFRQLCEIQYSILTCASILQ